MKLEFSQQIIQKNFMINFQVGTVSFQADRHDEGNRSFSQFMNGNNY